MSETMMLIILVVAVVAMTVGLKKFFAHHEKYNGHMIIDDEADKNEMN